MRNEPNYLNAVAREQDVSQLSKMLRVVAFHDLNQYILNPNYLGWFMSKLNT